ncbi:MAG: TVP38/TMEM64 family protein [Rhodospirillaceae bacterium]|nr:TVP38/TMEM64 family protein [Rhodospirillaceae bacterium]MBT4588564.1 TVP38/TMEM64 family protein [Rhodospirillaceae bacterium]MBT7954917.1 TVP38/TMEM64 family protein [Rhodospirillaceae bacterium]
MHFNTVKRVVLAVLIIAVALWGLLNHQKFDVESLVAWIAGYGMLAPLIFILARTIGAVFFVPGSLMGITAGVAFGPVWGAFYNLIASTIGAILAFLVARYVASDYVRQKLGGKGWISKSIEGVEAEGWRFVAFVRLVPLFPYNILNYALGLTRIKVSHFTAASFICMIPGDIAYVYIGYAGRETMAGNDAAIEIGLIALGLLAAIVFLPRLVQYFRSEKPALN